MYNGGEFLLCLAFNLFLSLPATAPCLFYFFFPMVGSHCLAQAGIEFMVVSHYNLKRAGITGVSQRDLSERV